MKWIPQRQKRVCTIRLHRRTRSFYRNVSFCFQKWPAFSFSVKCPDCNRQFRKYIVESTVRIDRNTTKLAENQPETLSLEGSVFPPTIRIFFPHWTWEITDKFSDEQFSNTTYLTPQKNTLIGINKLHYNIIATIKVPHVVDL